MSSSTQTLLERAYPHIASVIAPVAAAVAELGGRKTPHQCLLEARIGRLDTDKGLFQSGADPAFVSRILCNLETSPCFTAMAWCQQVDRFYLLPSGLQARTTTEAVSSSDGQEHHGTVTHVIKTSLAHLDMKWDGQPANESYNIRVSLKQEEPVFEDELQDRVDDLHIVRLKQRKTFTYASKCANNLVWEVDVTQVYEALTFVEAVSQLQHGMVTRYELSVRCKDPIAHLRAMRYDASRLAASLLTKIADFFDTEPKTQRLTLIQC
jgi:hypothetical protein